MVSWIRYAYDIVFPEDVAGGPRLANRSVFAMTDSGAPDGIKLDTQGNVYAGWYVRKTTIGERKSDSDVFESVSFDGVHIWNPHGTLVGKM